MDLRLPSLVLLGFAFACGSEAPPDGGFPDAADSGVHPDAPGAADASDAGSEVDTGPGDLGPRVVATTTSAQVKVIHARGGAVYFTLFDARRNAGELYKVGAGGGAPERIGEGLGNTVGIGSDGARVYVLDNGPLETLGGPPSNRRLWSFAPSRGGGAPVVIAEHQKRFGGMVLDATEVYWTERGELATQDGAVWRRDKMARTPTVSLARSQRLARDIALAGGGVVWISDTSIKRAELPMGANMTTMAAAEPSPCCLLSDGTSVFWIRDPRGAPAVARWSGGAITPFPTGAMQVQSAAIDATHVWFAEAAAGGRVLRLAKDAPAGTAPEAFSPPMPSPLHAVAVDETTVYFADDATIWALPKR